MVAKSLPYQTSKMTAFLSSSFFALLLLLFSLSSATVSEQTENGVIHEACKASRDPPTCESALSQSGHVLPTNATLLDVIQSATWVSAKNLDIAAVMVNQVLDSSAGNVNLTTAARGCLEGLINSQYRTILAAEVLPRGKFKDARAWMSAALGYQSGCSSGLGNVNTNHLTNETVTFLNDLVPLTANALGMLVNYDNFGEETGLWGPARTERDGFWDRVNGSGSWIDFNGGVPAGLEANVTVCNGGGCNYQTVQEAVDVAPNNAAGQRFVIWIKAGVYEETVWVPLQKKNVVFLGDGMGKTVITGSLNAGMPGISTYFSATVGELDFCHVVLV